MPATPTLVLLGLASLSHCAALVPHLAVRGLSPVSVRGGAVRAVDDADDAVTAAEEPIAVPAPTTDSKAGGIVAGAIVALVAIGGLLDQQSVLDAQSATQKDLAEISSGARVKAYMSGQAPERYPFPARPGDEYFKGYFEKQ